ncbi:septation protein A [Peristeroidobacter soli]|uniref:septation protein A n=1 Tax=Peristeroidobacter soli TaxID=2497877 RepID=UPI00389AAF9C
MIAALSNPPVDRQGPRPLMKLLFDFFPVIAFFLTYKITGNLFVATGVIIVAVIAQTAWQWFRHRKVSQMALISGVLVLIFGGLTLLIHDKVFIQWKVSVVNWLFAAGFLASRFFGDKLLIERMMGENVQLDPPVWRTLNWAWIVFFTALGIINLYIVYNFSEEVWVNFKLFGMLGLTVVFAIAQAIWLSSKMPPEDTSAPSEKPQ